MAPEFESRSCSRTRRGETGIAILAPITRRRADVYADGEIEDAERTRVQGFRSAYVFDIAQTDGDPLR